LKSQHDSLIPYKVESIRRQARLFDELVFGGDIIVLEGLGSEAIRSLESSVVWRDEQLEIPICMRVESGVLHR
jgi:hypothetical protein